MLSLRVFLVVASLLGLLVSLIGHVAILLGGQLSVDPVNRLLALGVILWLASGVEAYLLRRELRERGMSAIFEGAPRWMKWLGWAAAAYFVLNFFLTTGHWAGNVTSQDPGSVRIASAAGIMLFTYPLAVFYAAYRRANLAPTN